MMKTIEGKVNACAYTQGCWAANNGMRADHNPYEEGSVLRHSWDVGYRHVPMKESAS